MVSSKVQRCIFLNSTCRIDVKSFSFELFKLAIKFKNALNSLLLVPFNRCMQRRPIIIILQVQLGIGSYEYLSDSTALLGVLAEDVHDHVQAGVAVLVSPVLVGALVDEGPQDLDLVADGGQVQGRAVDAAAQVDVCARLDQHLRALDVVVSERDAEGRALVFVQQVGVGLSGQHAAQHPVVALGSCVVQHALLARVQLVLAEPLLTELIQEGEQHELILVFLR